MRAPSTMLCCVGLLASSAFISAADAELPSLRPLQTLSPLASDLGSPPPGFPLDARFGHAVAVRGEIALVGMPYTKSLAGRVGAYTRGTDRMWRRTATLTGSAGDTLFGRAIAFRENIAVIGSGSVAYLFKFQNATQQWKLLRRLMPNIGEVWSVDYQNGRVVVGGTDAALVYDIDSSGNVLRRSSLTAATALPEDRFGFDVALAGDTVVVGAPDDSSNDPANSPGNGAAYVFKLSSGRWVEQQKLSAADGELFDTFGFSVAIDKRMIIVGAPLYQIRGLPYFPPTGEPVAGGAGFVYTLDGSMWRLRTKLRPTTTEHAFYTAFGLHIAMFDTRVVVTAVHPIDVVTLDDRYHGLVFAYERAGSQLRPYAAAKPVSGVRLAGPGQPVSISNMTLFTGAPLSQCDTGCIGHAITYDLRQVSP